MGQQMSILSLSEAEQYVVLECVFEYISDIRTLMTLTLVSKFVRSVICRSNGLRVLTLRYFHPYWLHLNGVNVSDYDKDRGEKLKDGLRWIWTIGKRLKSVCLNRERASMCICDIVLPLYKSLATTEKRRIETIHIRGGIHCEMAFSLVRDNRNTLQCIELRDQRSFYLCPPLVKRLSLSGPSKSESFWSLLQQCERVKSLDLTLHDYDDPNFPLELVNVLRYTPLKHLGLRYKFPFFSKSEVLKELVSVLSVKNLCDNLESLEFGSSFGMFILSLVAELACSHTPAVFVNVTKLSFHFLELCLEPNPINWVTFWTVFPAVKEIKNSFWRYPGFYVQQGSALSQSLSNFCKTYLELCANRSCDIKIEEGVAYNNEDEKRMSAVAKAVTLPEDQNWCTSHGVQIETETRDEKVERVTLRKDTATLVFVFKYLQD